MHTKGTTMRPVVLAGCIAVVLAQPLCAQDLRVAPDYYIDGVFAASMAQQIALACPTLSVNPVATSTLSSGVLARLESEGYDITNLDFDVRAGQQALDQRVTAFGERTGLQSGALTETVCLAGQREIKAGSDVGKLLLTVGN